MNLTRRGKVLVGAVGLVIVTSIPYGGRGLAVIAGPGLIALGAAIVQLRTVERPTVSRRLSPNGPPGAEHVVDLRIDANHRLAASIEDDVDKGLTATGNETEAVVGEGTTISYEVTYERRGQFELGGTRITVTDLFGLVERTFVYWNPEPVTVYPPTEALSDSVRGALSKLLGAAGRESREHFEQLREYDEGDSLRDVHWKSSAKTPDQELLVAEYTGDERRDAILIAAQARDQRADETAIAAASIAATLLDRGYAVGLTTAHGTIAPGYGTAQRADVFEQLAILEAGAQPEKDPDAADVHVYTSRDRSSPVVRIGDGSYPFGDVTRAADDTPPTGVLSA
jgi:uncharacterized protein (DUF58 family)